MCGSAIIVHGLYQISSLHTSKLPILEPTFQVSSTPLPGYNILWTFCLPPAWTKTEKIKTR
jgi:hypothetical protein